jgi:hypothetical protein
MSFCSIQMANIYSRDWAERKAGLEQMLAKLRRGKEEEEEEGALLEMAIPIVKRALQDQLFQVKKSKLI